MLLGKYINKYYKKFWLFYLVGIALLIAVDVFHAYVPEKLGQVVSLFGEMGKRQTAGLDYSDITAEIVQIGWFVLYVGLGMFAGRIIWRYSLFFPATRIEAALREEMFKKATRLDPYFYHKETVGTILNWFTSDLEEILEFLKWGTIQIVDASFLSVFVLIKMFRLSWQLSLFTLVPVVLIALWSYFAETLFTEKWLLRQKSNDKIYDYSQESFTGIRVIKAFVKERQQIRAFDKIARENKDVDIGVTRFFIFFERIIDVCLSASFGVLMAIGGFFAVKSSLGAPVWGVELDAGQLVTFIAYFDTLLWPIFALGGVISSHARANASLKRITIFLEQNESIVNCSNPIKLENVKGEIVFKDLTFQYPDMSEPHLKHINLTIKPGESIGVVGKIGCGKTTISNLICRLYNPPKGTVFIDGIDILDADVASLRNAISYVPQDNFLFSDTVESNIGFGKKDFDELDIEVAARFSDVHNDIVGFKDGYQTMVGERGTTLSGGQKQRISMARAYIKDAPIMIMDDAVSAVDVKTEETILHNIEVNRRGKTTIIVASRISTVSKLDKVLVLNEGCVEAFDTPKNLLKISKTYAKMHLLQELEKEEVKGGN